MNDLRTRIIIEAINNTQKTLKDIQGDLNGVQKQTSGLGSLFSSKGVVITAALTGIALGIKKVVSETAKFEQTKVAFNTLVGSAVEAKTVLNDLQAFAAKTPFTLPGIEDSGKMLLAFGINTKELIPTLKSIGDISSGIGLREDGMQRLILNLGQIQTQGKLTGRELRDFAVNGVPILDMLADSMGKSKNEIQEMTTAGQIMAKDVKDAFTKATSEGGKFADMMGKQSKTMLGLWSNLQDTISIQARKIGVNLIAPMKVALPFLISLVEPLGKIISSVINIFAKLATIVAVAGKNIMRAIIIVRDSIIAFRQLSSDSNTLIGRLKGVAGFVGTAFTTAFNVAVKAIQGFIEIISKIPVLGDAIGAVSSSVSDAVELMAIDFRIMNNDITNAKMEAERDFSDLVNSFTTGGADMGGAINDTAEEVKEARKKMAEDLNDMNTDYWDMVVDVNRSLLDLKTKHAKTMSDLEDDIIGVQEKVSELEKDYKDKFTSIGESLGEAFVDSQNDIDKLKTKIKELNAEIASSDSGDKKIKLSTELSESTAELERLEAAQKRITSSEFAKQYADQIAEVKRLSSLTDIERAFEDAKKQQTELTAETERRALELATELAAINEKKEAEKSAYESHRNELLATKQKMQDFQMTVVAAMSDMENQTEEKVALMGKHLKDLQKILQDVDATVSAINSRSGNVKPVGKTATTSSINTSSNTITVNLGGVTIKNAEDEKKLTQAITDALNNITSNNA